MYGIEANTQHNSSAAMSNLTPLYGFVNVITGGGTAIWGRSLQTCAQVTASGVLSNWAGTYMLSPKFSTGGTITNAYGHFVENLRTLVNAGNITNAFGLWIDGGEARFMDIVNIQNTQASRSTSAVALTVAQASNSTANAVVISNPGTGVGLNINQTGSANAVNITNNNAGGSNQYAAVISGNNYGINLTTANASGTTLNVTHNSSGNGTVVAVINKGSGLSFDIQVGSTPASAFQVLSSGQVKFAASGNETTGSGSASLGTNSPAVTNSAPYTWEKVTTSDGSQGYIPVWK